MLPGFQPEIVPLRLAKTKNELTVPEEDGIGKPAPPVNTCPVGPWEAEVLVVGMATTKREPIPACTSVML